MICKSNNNSYHHGTSAFFQSFFFEKDPHLNVVEETELLDYNKNSDKTSKTKRCFQLIVPVEMNSLGNMEQRRRRWIKPNNEYLPPRLPKF